MLRLFESDKRHDSKRSRKTCRLPNLREQLYERYKLCEETVSDMVYYTKLRDHYEENKHAFGDDGFARCPCAGYKKTEYFHLFVDVHGYLDKKAFSHPFGLPDSCDNDGDLYPHVLDNYWYWFKFREGNEFYYKRYGRLDNNRILEEMDEDQTTYYILGKFIRGAITNSHVEEDPDLKRRVLIIDCYNNLFIARPYMIEKAIMCMHVNPDGKMRDRTLE